MTSGRVTMGQLWKLFEDYLDRQPFPPSQRRVAAKLEMSPTAFGNWRGPLSRMPDADNLVRFADLINMPYERVIDAALHDAGYLPRPKLRPWDDPRPNSGLDPAERDRLMRSVSPDEYADTAARDIGRPSRGQQKRAQAERAGEPPADNPDDMEPR